MTRPQIVRADTLDLQDHETPSAKDHTKQPEQPAPLGSGRPAPHQELSIRHAEQDTKSEILTAETGNGYGVGAYGEDETEDDMDQNYEHEDRDLADGESDDLLDDDLMDKISSSPSIDDEDIDFEFVYALHNFVATVDGQANAAKGDTMVLLDDSNSYWWLVRVTKDGSIGYLPAEHIETPTERLARLNKHRNVDLSATMLGDNSEKSKNPLKKAMRRRNAKTVNFAPPTYIEASDVEYSSDEDSERGDFFNDDETETVESEEGDGQEQDDIVVEPLRPKGLKEKSTETEGKGSPDKPDSEQAGAEPRRSSDEFFDPDEPTVSRSRNGTVRNTDSFFKDDTAEPKKISLTPNLLRDETTGNVIVHDWKESRGSFDTIDKPATAQDSKTKEKEDRKRKEKKPGMLSGLFKRKDKKSKSADDEFDDSITSPTESSFRASPQPKTSSESFDSRSSRSQRQNSNKLQKSPPTAMSPTATEPSNDPGQSIRRVASQEATSLDEARSPVSIQSPSKDAFATPMESQDPFASPEDRPSSEAQRRTPNDAPVQKIQTKPSVMSPPQKFPPTMAPSQPEPEPESPVDVSPVEGHIPILAPGLTRDAVERAHSVSPLSPPSSPEAEMHDLKISDPKVTEAKPGSLDTLSVDTPTWSDASLRSYMDDEENDIRDLYIIVHDKSNIPPAGPDHPVTGRLFEKESKRLKEMNNELDSMLVGWMERRKQRAIARDAQNSTQNPAS